MGREPTCIRNARGWIRQASLLRGITASDLWSGNRILEERDACLRGGRHNANVRSWAFYSEFFAIAVVQESMNVCTSGHMTDNVLRKSLYYRTRELQRNLRLKWPERIDCHLAKRCVL